MIYFLLHNTITASLLALVAVFVCRWRRSHPALRHALWLVVMVKLVAPPLPVWSFAWPSDWSALWTTSVAEPLSPSETNWRPAPLRANVAEHQGLPLPGAPESFVVLDGTKQQLPPELARNHANYAPVSWTHFLTWEDFSTLLGRGWFAGIAVMAIYQVYRWQRFQRLLDSSSLAPEWLVDEVAAVAREFSIRAPEACVLRARCTPFVWVLGRVRLLWPESMLDGFSPESRRTIIAHELAHLARRDHWVARFVMFAAIFWWWHPLFWYVRAMLHDAAEQACDARVTQFLPAARKAYAQALIEVCELLANGITPGPALGVGSQTRRAFERRLTMIMREKIASRLSLGAVAGVGLLALVVLPGFTPAQDAPTSATPEPATVPAAPLTPALPAPETTPAIPTPSLPAAPATDPVPSTAPAPALPPLPSAATATPSVPFADHPQSAPTVPRPPVVVPDGGGNFYLTPDSGEAAAPEDVVHLTRATYRLPQELAEPFSEFLNNTLGNVVQSSVQVTQQPVKDPSAGPQVVSRIVVTADENTQKIVGHFIGLLRTHGRLDPGVTPAVSLGNAAASPLPWVDATVRKAGALAAEGQQQPAFDQPEQKPQPKFAPGYPVQAPDEDGNVQRPYLDRYDDAPVTADPQAVRRGE